jgi:hypothetical protein
MSFSSLRVPLSFSPIVSPSALSVSTAVDPLDHPHYCFGAVAWTKDRKLTVYMIPSDMQRMDSVAIVCLLAFVDECEGGCFIADLPVSYSEEGNGKSVSQIPSGWGVLRIGCIRTTARSKAVKVYVGTISVCQI